MRLSQRAIALLAILLTILPLSASVSAEEKPWREIRSPHFRVITNGREAAGRRVARGFEQMRGVFANEFQDIVWNRRNHF
jgi:hypothetical protein